MLDVFQMNPFSSILILLAAFLAVFLEASFQGVRHLLGAQVDLLPALMVYASLSANLLTVSLLAVLGGLGFDSLSANPLGITVLPLFVIGLLIYRKRNLILREQFFAQWVLGLGASAVVPLLTLLLLLTAGKTPLLGWGSLWQWMVMSAGGGIAAPAFFRLFGIFENALSYRRNTQISFRPDREIKRGRK
jgi:rod shape-determining protein MreD